MRLYKGIRLESKCIVNGKLLKHNSICEQIATAIRDRIYGDAIDIGYVNRVRLYDDAGGVIKDLDLLDKAIIDKSSESPPYLQLRFCFADFTSDEYTFYNALLYTSNNYSVAEAYEATGYTKLAGDILPIVWLINIYYMVE